MKQIFFILIILVLFILKTNAQNNIKRSQFCFNDSFVADSFEVILIGEDHSMSNTPHKMEIIKQINKQTNNLVVALEYPRIFQIYLTDYLDTGNERAYKMLKKQFLQNKKDQLKLIRGLRCLKETEKESKDFKIICIDLTTDQGKHIFHDISAALEYLNDPRLNDFYSIIKQFNLKKKSFDESIDELFADLKVKKMKYESILGADYYVILEALEGLEIINNCGKVNITNEKLILEREKYMAKILHLASINNSQGKLLVFNGAFHGSLIEFDSMTMFPSFNYILKNSYDHNTFSLITLYYKQKRPFFDQIFGFADYFEFFYFDIDKLLKDDPSCNIYFIQKNELQNSPVLYERYDAAILPHFNQ